jgi:hypothetical protein
LPPFAVFCRSVSSRIFPNELVRGWCLSKKSLSRWFVSTPFCGWRERGQPPPLPASHPGCHLAWHRPWTARGWCVAVDGSRIVHGQRSTNGWHGG